MIFSDVLPYLTFTLGFGIGFSATRGQVKNTLLSIEIKHKEAQIKKVLVETAQQIVKTEEKGGGIKIRSKNEQAIVEDAERNRVKELFSDDAK